MEEAYLINDVKERLCYVRNHLELLSNFAPEMDQGLRRLLAGVTRFHKGISADAFQGQEEHTSARFCDARLCQAFLRGDTQS